VRAAQTFSWESGEGRTCAAMRSDAMRRALRPLGTRAKKVADCLVERNPNLQITVPPVMLPYTVGLSAGIQHQFVRAA
jgi:hypothetical protein